MKTREIFLFFSFFFLFFNLEIWFRFWYCGLTGFDLGRTDAWHWFVKPLLFLVRVPMVVFLWFFKFLRLNYLTNLPSLAHIFVSRWPIKFILMLRLVESPLVMLYSITFLFCLPCVWWNFSLDRWYIIFGFNSLFFPYWYKFWPSVVFTKSFWVVVDFLAWFVCSRPAVLLLLGFCIYMLTL